MDFPTENIIVKSDLINIYPNPASDYVFVNQEFEMIELYDITGKIVLKEFNNNKINVSDLNTGLYILKINFEGKTLEQKLQIQK